MSIAGKIFAFLLCAGFSALISLTAMHLEFETDENGRKQFPFSYFFFILTLLLCTYYHGEECNAKEISEIKEECYDTGYDDGYNVGYNDGYYDEIEE